MKIRDIAGGIPLIALALLIGGAFGTVASSQSEQKDNPGLIGAWDSHRLQESYEISIGKTALGKPNPIKLHTEDRSVLQISQHYGDLVGVTGNAEATVFWYQDGAGVIRNVVIPDASSHAVRLEMQTLRNFKTKRINN